MGFFNVLWVSAVNPEDGELYRPALQRFLVEDVLPYENGDHESFCPRHENPETSKKPSARLNFSKGIGYCFVCKPTGDECSLESFYDDAKARTAGPVKRGDATYSEIPAYLVGEPAKPKRKKRTPAGEAAPDNVRSLDEKRDSRARRSRPAPTEEDLSGFTENLVTTARLNYLRKERGLTKRTIAKFHLGWVANRQRYIIPCYLNGEIVNARLYKPHAESDKMMWWTSGSKPNYMIGLEVLDTDTEWILLLEGEWDAILASQDGLPALGHTAGAGAWLPVWNKHFKDKDVFIAFDNDDAGRKGRKKVAKALEGVARSIYFVDMPGPDGADYTDFRMKDGKSAEDFQLLLKQTREDGPVWREEDHALPTRGDVRVTVAESQSDAYTGRPVEMVAHVTGRQDPPYVLPKSVRYTCDQDNGSNCDKCPMKVLHGGDLTKDFAANDRILFELVDAPEEKAEGRLQKVANARCKSHLIMEVINTYSVEQLTVEETIERKREAADSEGNVTGVRQIFNVGHHDTEINTSVRVVGNQISDPRNRRAMFTSWLCEPVKTSLDEFRVTPEIRSLLSHYQVEEGQQPMEKMEEVARDMAANVTGIIGAKRIDLHIAFDLAWHSILNFRFLGQRLDKGWLEFMIVGDSRTGKSEVAKRLSAHYNSTTIYACDQASLAGLIGGVNQPVGRQWQVRWGALPINDRRMVVLDEAQSLKDKGIIEHMSSIRSSGQAEITKIETAATPARVRTVWIANPLNGRTVRELADGAMDGIRQLLPAHEDIARFDFAMGVARDEVESGIINSRRRKRVPHRYTSEMATALVMWCWSRTADQVVWDAGVEDFVLEQATVLGDRYTPDFPLIQHENARIKLARLAVAVAARVYSTDETGEKVVVKREHVQTAVSFLHLVYDDDVFGYGRLSRRVTHEQRLAVKNSGPVESWLRGAKEPDTNGQSVFIALNALGGSFEDRYFFSAAGVTPDDGRRSLEFLLTQKMLRLMGGGRKYVVQPALSTILRRIDDENIERMEKEG